MYASSFENFLVVVTRNIISAGHRPAAAPAASSMSASAMLSLAAGHSQRASGATGRTLSLAAAEAARVLDPAAGRTVGALDDIGAEAVLFEGPVDPDIDRRLAVYAEDAAPLRLVGEGLTTEDVREGYWIGLVADGVETLEAVLHVGDVTHAWTLDLCLASSTGPE